MRFSAKTGLAIGLASLIIAEHAFSKSKDAPRFTDPDLIALEKIGARAKKAMDAFVLRPRLPDSYNFVCSGCGGDDDKSFIPQIARAPARKQNNGGIVADPDASQPTGPRYVSLQSVKAKRAMALKRRAAIRRRNIKQAAQFDLELSTSQSWDAELRR